MTALPPSSAASIGGRPQDCRASPNKKEADIVGSRVIVRIDQLFRGYQPARRLQGETSLALLAVAVVVTTPHPLLES